MAPVINAQNLFKRYPGFAPVLRGANIQVEQGEMVAVMGPSGCGKSTMLHILGMLHAPDSGTLEILGTNVLSLNREETAAFRRGNMGFVMQSSNLFEHSTVFENVEFPLIYENVPPQERWGRVIRALELVRLSARVHYPGNRLSGGEQQRVAIARAMVNNPRILLADEPTGALDERTSRLIMQNFQNLCHSGGVAMVMVTHDPNMAEYCDTVYKLQEGKLVCQKHEPGPYTQKKEENFLAPPAPAVNGVLISACFPSLKNPDLSEIARRLSTCALLSRIYSLYKHFLADDSKGYSLPLPVRRMLFFSRLMGLRLFFSRARSSNSLWQLWKLLPARQRDGIGLGKRLMAFSAGSVLARWALQDNIQFFYSSDASAEATAAWVASRLLRRPFAFHVRPEDLSLSSPNWQVKAEQAIFVSCPSKSVMQKMLALFPDIKDRLLLVYSPPVVMPSEDESLYASGQENSKYIEMVSCSTDFSQKGYQTVLSACSILKRSGIAFRLSILGKTGRKEKKMAKLLGLEVEMQYPGIPRSDSIAESFKTANIFIAPEPDSLPEKMIIPIYLREALAYGVAIATCGMSAGMAEILKDKENCLVSSLEDDKGLAKNLELLSNNTSERARLGTAGRKKLIDLLNLESVNQKIFDLVTKAAGTSKNPEKE